MKRIKEEKMKWERAWVEKLQDQESLNSKRWWQLAKSILKKDDGHFSCPAVKVNNHISEAPVFNGFFLENSTINDEVSLLDATCHADNNKVTLSTPRRSTLRQLNLCKIILLRLVSSDVNYTKLVWLFCTDRKSFSIYSHWWYS